MSDIKEKTTAYAEVRIKIIELQDMAKKMEEEILAEAISSGEKGYDTPLGRVGTVATYVYKYSEGLLQEKKDVEEKIKEITNALRAPIKAKAELEEKEQEPEIKLGIRFVQNKKEK